MQGTDSSARGVEAGDETGVAAVDVADVVGTRFAPQFREQQRHPVAAVVSSQGAQDRF